MESAFAIRLIPRQIEPPLDLNWLAEWFGVEVEIRPLPKKVAGLYLLTTYGPHIILNSNDSRKRQRWTIAHELAHHVLDVGRQSTSVEFRISTNDRDSVEDTCDRFAAEILMPAAVVRRKAAELGGGHFDRAALLADKFEVSITAMRIRLRELKLDPKSI